MNTQAEATQIRTIVLMMEELRTRRSPYYAEGLQSIITRLPASPEREQLTQHRQEYLASLEAQQ